MTTTTRTAPSTRTSTPRPAPALGLEARLALADAEMTLRIEQALTRLAVDTAHPETQPAEVAEVSTEALTAHTTRNTPAPDLYPTPVAALLQRAANRLETGGWCRGATRDTSGALCLYGAIHAEADGRRGAEDDALTVLMEAIRRTFGPGAHTVPAVNDRLPNGAAAVGLLQRAALIADARGI
ncbi:hypothetical protein ACFC1B_07185 [Streptomyces xiamenensis]|uniref:DUF6197 family protein n=1 Tax=Streptomyces xiamenensis TaxID=408015 RepID=UPI0035E261D7